jgi:hypothetical protein
MPLVPRKRRPPTWWSARAWGMPACERVMRSLCAVADVCRCIVAPVVRLHASRCRRQPLWVCARG